MPQAQNPLGIGQQIAIFTIHCYRNILSTMVLHECRFMPTCSVYAEESVRKFGLFKGVRRTLWRLLRCHPFCESGEDPVL